MSSDDVLGGSPLRTVLVPLLLGHCMCGILFVVFFSSSNLCRMMGAFFLVSHIHILCFAPGFWIPIRTQLEYIFHIHFLFLFRGVSLLGSWGYHSLTRCFHVHYRLIHDVCYCWGCYKCILMFSIVFQIRLKIGSHSVISFLNFISLSLSFLWTTLPKVRGLKFQ